MEGDSMMNSGFTLPQSRVESGQAGHPHEWEPEAGHRENAPMEQLTRGPEIWSGQMEEAIKIFRDISVSILVKQVK